MRVALKKVRDWKITSEYLDGEWHLTARDKHGRTRLYKKGKDLRSLTREFNAAVQDMLWQSPLPPHYAQAKADGTVDPAKVTH